MKINVYVICEYKVNLWLKLGSNGTELRTKGVNDRHTERRSRNDRDLESKQLVFYLYYVVIEVPITIRIY